MDLPYVLKFRTYRINFALQSNSTNNSYPCFNAGYFFLKENIEKHVSVGYTHSCHAETHIHKIKIQVRISWTSMLYTTINVVYNHVVLYLDWQWKLHNERNMYAHKTNFLPLDMPTQTSLRVFFQFRFQPLDTLLNNWFHWRNKNTAFQQSVQRLETKLKEDTAIVVWGGVTKISVYIWSNNVAWIKPQGPNK